PCCNGPWGSATAGRPGSSISWPRMGSSATTTGARPAMCCTRRSSGSSSRPAPTREAHTAGTAAASLARVEHRNLWPDLPRLAREIATDFPDRAHAQGPLGDFPGLFEGSPPDQLLEGGQERRAHAQSAQAHAEQRQEAPGPARHLATDRDGLAAL